MQVALHPGPPEALLDEWAELPEATPFMSAGWAGAWFRHYPEAKPLLMTARADGRLVALAPLVVRRRGPLRILEAAGIEPGDYWDVLATGPEAVDAVVEGIARSRAWDAWIVRFLPPGSHVPHAIEAAGLPTLIHDPTPAPAIELPDTFDEYLKALSSNRRSNLRKHLRRLDNEIQLREITDPQELPATLARWQDFRRRQWEAADKEIDPEHLAPRFQAFLGDCLTALLPAGRALVWEFVKDEEVIGTYVNFADAESFHWYLGGFDPAHTKLGIGKIAIGHGIRTSIEAGRRRYDFGRGAEDYKYWYGAVDRPLPALVAGARGPRGRAALAAARLVLSRRA